MAPLPALCEGCLLAPELLGPEPCTHIAGRSGGRQSPDSL